MSILSEIYDLSKEPIFFISPNIDIKFHIIKQNRDALNIRFRNLLEDDIDYDEYPIFNIDYLVKQMITYLNNRETSSNYFDEVEKNIETFEGKYVFYINAFLSFYYFDTNNYEMAEQYLKYALNYIKKNECTDYERMCIYSLTANFLQKTKDIFISGSEAYFLKALRLVKGVDKLAEIAILNAISYHYHNIERIDDSVKYINRALNIADEINIPDVVFSTYKNAGIIYVTKGNFERASYYFEKAIRCIEHIEDKMEYIKLLNTLGYGEFLKGDFKSSLETFKRAINILTNLSNVTKLLDESVKTFDNIALTCKFLGDIEASIYMQELSKDILENINYINRVNEVHNLSKVYTDLGIDYLIYKNDINRAEYYLKLAYKYTDENEHYIKRSKKLLLDALINYNKYQDGLDLFHKTIDLLIQKGSDNLYVQIILMEFLTYYYSLSMDESKFNMAKNIAEKYCLEKQFEALKRTILENYRIDEFNVLSNPLNFFRLLSLQRKQILLETRKSRDYEIFEELSFSISSCQNIEDLFKTASDVLNKYFLSKCLLVFSYDTQQVLVIYSDSDLKEKGVGFIKELVDNFRMDSGVINLNNECTKSCIVSKIMDDEGLYYFVLCNDSKSDWYFNLEQVKTFNLLVNNMFLKYKNICQLETIKLSVVTDYMTGLKNAAYYNKRIKELIQRYNKNNIEFGMALMDLNKFKQINDKFGHEAGDSAIKHFAKILKNEMQNTAEIIRYGGDEFILLFEEDYKKVEALIYKVKLELKNNPLFIDDVKIILDFSYGIEMYDGQGEANLFRNTDFKMYKNKNKVS
ncbi:MAG: diguanylate cyclase protein [Caloramator sp.]|jgi:diguanylate cyclase (GGDEF)-like protein|uniref:tetratricopeptide repeat-containing diguanylate cyclase n=1 Tax=Caloramator sp. TaxID=1871330 RepID=UPI001E05C216|nr:tetratricopeptide repeat-containing diguanylate cyclase [Caloramator sp.]MBZ4662469.1 diguanylate cyclase protein [Caloramator sp.]